MKDTLGEVFSGRKETYLSLLRYRNHVPKIDYSRDCVILESVDPGTGIVIRLIFAYTSSRNFRELSSRAFPGISTWGFFYSFTCDLPQSFSRDLSGKILSSAASAMSLKVFRELFRTLSWFPSFWDLCN